MLLWLERSTGLHVLLGIARYTFSMGHHRLRQTPQRRERDLSFCSACSQLDSDNNNFVRRDSVFLGHLLLSIQSAHTHTHNLALSFARSGGTHSLSSSFSSAFVRPNVCSVLSCPFRPAPLRPTATCHHRSTHAVTRAHTHRRERGHTSTNLRPCELLGDKMGPSDIVWGSGVSRRMGEGAKLGIVN